MVVQLEEVAAERLFVGCSAVQVVVELGGDRAGRGKLVGWWCEMWVLQGSELFWVCG